MELIIEEIMREPILNFNFNQITQTYYGTT